MKNTYKLREIYARLRDATDPEVLVIREGMKLISPYPDDTPLMELTCSLDDAVHDVISKYADIS